MIEHTMLFMKQIVREMKWKNKSCNFAQYVANLTTSFCFFVNGHFMNIQLGQTKTAEKPFYEAKQGYF